MQAARLLTRRPHETDGRVVRLWLSPHGRELQPVIEHERAQLSDRALAELDVDERVVLIRALTKIVLAFGGNPNPPGDAD